MAGWKTLSSEEVYQTPWIRVRRDEVLNHLGKPLTYSVIELRHPSVFIVATDSQGRIMVQTNYRYTIDRDCMELPAGHSDGEDLLQAAQRELLEETGWASDDWVDLGNLYQAVGIGNIQMQAFLARNVHKTEQATEDLEDISSQTFLSLEDIENLARKGQINNAPMLGVLYLAKLHGL